MPFRVADDGITPKEVYNWRIYTVTLMACAGACMFGYNLGVIGGCIVLPEFHREFRLPDKDTSDYSFITANIISCMQGGTFFGSLLALPLTERYGRVPIMGLAGLIFAAGSAMQTFAAGSLAMMYAGRLVGGLGLGVSSFLVPLYLAELSPPSIRGMIVGMHEIVNQISGVCGFWVNYGTLNLSGNKQWMIPLGVQMAPGALLFLACLILPESPRFLVRKGRIELAGKNLGWIRGFGKDWSTNTEISEVGRQYLSKELGDIIIQTDNERREIAAGRARSGTGEKNWKDYVGLGKIFRTGDLRRLGVGVSLFVCQQLTGVNAVNYYSPSIFRSVGFTGTNVGLFASGVYAIVKTVVTLLALAFFIDRTGRRRLLMIGAFGGSMAMWYIGGYITAANIDPDQPGSKTTGGWVAIVCIYLWAGSFSIAWNGIPWIYCSEIFPGRIRSLCVSITTATQWLWQFIISRATPYMLSDLRGGTYFFFATCMFITVGWVYLFVPETKGRTLESMDELFGHGRRDTATDPTQDTEKSPNVVLQSQHNPQVVGIEEEKK